MPNEEQDRGGVRLGHGFARPPERTAPPPEIASLPEQQAADVDEVEVSLRADGVGWLVPPFRLDEQRFVIRLPAARAVELAVPRLREERHWAGPRYPRRPA